MSTRFEAHGTLTTRLEGRMLVVEGTGPWNLESLNQSGDNAAVLLDQLAGEPWTAMVILHGECIYVQAAGDLLSEIIKQEKKQGRQATAFLLNDCDSPNFAKLHLTDIFDRAGETFEFFEDAALAKVWLEEKRLKAQKLISSKVTF